MQEQLHPDKSKYRETLFWDTDFGTLDWQRNSEWIIRRVFEYGNEDEIQETIRYYGEDKIVNVLQVIKDSWNSQNRNDNVKKYLSYEFED